jgi:hypothetical protein
LRTDLLTIDQGFAFPPGFPPDPGEEGKQTTDGIDADRDGVRDDVQRWIHAVHPDDTAKRMALRQWARFFQHSLKEEYGLEVRQENRRILYRAMHCQNKALEDTIQNYSLNQHLKAKVLSTYAAPPVI